jgi:hypothetical protein
VEEVRQLTEGHAAMVTIYAIFICYVQNNTCEPVQDIPTFTSLVTCEQTIDAYFPGQQAGGDISKMTCMKVPAKSN